MPKKHYHITVPYSGQIWIEVDASSDEEALKLACEQAIDAPIDDPELDYDGAEIEEIIDPSR